MILDYSTYLEDRHASGVGTHNCAENPELFFKQRGWCPFCQPVAPQVYQDKDNLSYPVKEISDESFMDLSVDEYIEQDKNIAVRSCDKCGWWELERSYSDNWMWIQDMRHAILRSFEPSDITLPVETLRKYLVSNPETIYKIHSRKMEELVQAVFKDFFHCEVVHCGRSHDGGIDLVLISADKPAVIQVKRRENPNSVESVNTVRNLLGATLLQQMQHAAIVTTADHFSSEAQAEANRAITLDLVKSFDLIDANRFFDMLHLIHKGKEELWRVHLLELWRRHEL